MYVPIYVLHKVLFRHFIIFLSHIITNQRHDYIPCLDAVIPWLREKDNLMYNTIPLKGKV